MAGLEPQLGHIEGAIEAAALDPDASLTEARIEQLIADADAARTRIREGAYQQLHRDPYRAELGPSILARVPADLDATMERVVVNAASRLGFRVEHARGPRAYVIEFGNEAVIDSLPGVASGSAFVGSFDREYAVENETIDFFASGHALVEGLLAHFEEDPKGRVARLEIAIPGQPGAGLVAIYKEGPQFEVVALDADGSPRPDWAAAFARVPSGAQKMQPHDVAAYDWAALASRLAARLGARDPHAIAAIVVRPRKPGN
jgi:ATP-dependent helicase HepA